MLSEWRAWVKCNAKTAGCTNNSAFMRMRALSRLRCCGLVRLLAVTLRVMKLDVDHELDASGLMCPLPLLKAKLALNAMQPQQVLKVIATDPGSERDFHVFVQQSRHTILEFAKDDTAYYYWIRKG
jgi:tRNA 2-thiouridine synthesizing protein A